MNTDLKKLAKDEFEKCFCKFSNHTVFGETTENVQNTEISSL